MTAMRFVDTNVLAYAASPVSEGPRKRRRALEVLAEPDLAVSVQVLQEFYHQATRDTRRGKLSPADALDFLEPILMLRVQSVTPDVFRAGAALSRRFRLSYWDARDSCRCGRRRDDSQCLRRPWVSRVES